MEGEYDEAVVKKKVDRVLVRKDGDIKILFIKKIEHLFG